MKKSFTTILLIVFAMWLSGCEFSKKTEAPPVKLDDMVCENNFVAKEYHARLMSELQSMVGETVQRNYSDLVDGAKVMDGFQKSRFIFNKARLDPGMRQSPRRAECVAGLNIMLDQAVYDLSQVNSPLIYGGNRYAAEVDNISSMNRISRSINNIMQEVHYSLELDDKGEPVRVVILPQEIQRFDRVIAAMLLPYGVKDRVVVNGKPMSREEGLAKISFVDSDIRSDDGMPDLADPASLAEREVVPPEVLSRAKDEKAQLGRKMNGIWNSLDPTIRSTLESEQNDWSRNLSKNCKAMGEGIENEGAAAKAVLDCEIDELRKRVVYLQGFSI